MFLILISPYHPLFIPKSYSRERERARKSYCYTPCANSAQSFSNAAVLLSLARAGPQLHPDQLSSVHDVRATLIMNHEGVKFCAACSLFEQQRTTASRSPFSFLSSAEFVAAAGSPYQLPCRFMWTTWCFVQILVNSNWRWSVDCGPIRHTLSATGGVLHSIIEMGWLK